MSHAGAAHMRSRAGVWSEHTCRCSLMQTATRPSLPRQTCGLKTRAAAGEPRGTKRAWGAGWGKKAADIKAPSPPVAESIPAPATPTATDAAPVSAQAPPVAERPSAASVAAGPAAPSFSTTSTAAQGAAVAAAAPEAVQQVEAEYQDPITAALEATHQLADKLRSVGAVGSCLVGSCILLEVLQKRGIQVHLKKGFLVMDGRVALWHVWVELRDNRLLKLDVAWMSQEALMPPEAKPKLVQLVDQLPPGVVHLEGDTQEEQEMLALSEASWAAIQRQGVDAGFWADQPPAMQWLRREMLQQMGA